MKEFSTFKKDLFAQTPVETINIELSSNHLNLITATDTRVIVVPQISTISPNKNYIINLQTASTTQASFIATHRLNDFSNILSIFNGAYSIFEPNNDLKWQSLARINALTTEINTKEATTKVIDTYPLSIFNIIDKIK